MIAAGTGAARVGGSPIGAPTVAGDALMSVDRGHLFYTGPIEFLTPHHLAAPTLVMGLYEPLRIRASGAGWITCRAALITPGTVHELDFGDAPMAALAIDRTRGDLEQAWRALRGGEAGAPGLAVARRADVAPMRRLFEDARAGDYAVEAVDDLGRWLVGPEAPLDPRVRALAEQLSATPDDTDRVQATARATGLSASRLAHLFTACMGVSPRRYRVWSRVLAATGHALGGASLTDAAHATGFSDSAHFSREFRATCGLAPSSAMRRIGRLAVG
ncbi:MAG: AraC family transcriptional regulator [Burkholderiales bacterium]|nr:AraC family transcriptional regulator [Burkholderiales bacterium]